MSIVKRVHTGNYSTISNECFRDKTLSARAKGIYAWVMTLPPEWKLHKNRVEQNFTEGRDAINKAWKELIDAGYIVKSVVPLRPGDKSLIPDSCWTFYEQSQKSVGFQVTGNQSPENPVLIIKEKEIKERVNTKKNKKKYTKEKEESNFLGEWNKRAVRHGFGTHRVFLPKYRQYMVKCEKIISDNPDSSWEDFWNHVGAIMKEYEGSTYVNYFTLEFALRPDSNFPSILLEGRTAKHFPLEADPKYKSRLVKIAQLEYEEIRDKCAKFYRKLHKAMAEATSSEKIAKYKRLTDKYDRLCGEARKRIETLQSGE